MSNLILSNLYRDRTVDFTVPTLTRPRLAELEKGRLTIYNAHNDEFVGIEYEIENCEPTDDVPMNIKKLFHAYWVADQDGSLRNNGIEFISNPVKGDHITNALLSLQGMLNGEMKNHTCTGRCGIHVHINALDLSVPQVFAWISTYMIFERQLYKFSGARDKNLFCLPTWAWNANVKSAITYLEEDNIRNQTLAVQHLQELGMKYTGLNLVPLAQHGTFEFRQMSTTTDFNKISIWIALLTRIKVYSKRFNTVNSLQEYWKYLGSLNTTSEYGHFMEEVFGDLFSELRNDNYEKDMAKGVVAIKELEILHIKARPILNVSPAPPPIRIPIEVESHSRIEPEALRPIQNSLFNTTTRADRNRQIAEQVRVFRERIARQTARTNELQEFIIDQTPLGTL